jgi:hypothetical protein
MKVRSVSLESSAREFLGEALLNFKQGKLNFSILHAVTATELLLKEKLSRIHPNLVYKSIDVLVDNGSKSVGLDCLPKRLANFGVTISKGDLELIDKCARWRAVSRKVWKWCNVANG